MILGVTMQWLAFSLFALLAVLGALGMTTTMSMFRSGIFLMASFIGVAGLFILLSADLIGLLQIMMYIGGMLVMILFMLLFSMDPGGAMMAGMQMSPVERLFSRGLKPQDKDNGNMTGMNHGDDSSSPDSDSEGPADESPDGEHGGRQSQHHAAMRHAGADGMRTEGENSAPETPNGENDHSKTDHSGMNHDDMQMDGDMDDMDSDMDMGGMDMSMVTPARPWAAWLGLAVTAVLVGLLLWRPAWPLSAAVPDPDSARQVGTLLMGKYMIAFEGAGLLILLGIFGAVFLQRPGSHPSDPGREAYVTADQNPVPISKDEP